MSSDMLLVRETDLGLQQVCTHTVPISNSAAVRVYSDTRPHNWKIADLQKGLILVFNGKETIGEGTGFGLPILVYSDETYFSANSRVQIAVRENRCVIRKEFIMDRVARNRFRNVTLENRKARNLIAFLAHLYQTRPQFRFLTLKGLTREMSINTAFVKAASKGKVIVTYVIDKRRILVNADFRQSKRERLRKIFMLNEQGSEFFRKYIDSRGTQMSDEEIGAWDGMNAEWACLNVPQHTLGFRLWRVENGILRRGREFLKGSLDWVGLDYEISPMSPVFEYTIEILGA